MLRHANFKDISEGLIGFNLAPVYGSYTMRVEAQGCHDASPSCPNTVLQS